MPPEPSGECARAGPALTARDREQARRQPRKGSGCFADSRTNASLGKTASKTREPTAKGLEETSQKIRSAKFDPAAPSASSLRDMNHSFDDTGLRLQPFRELANHFVKASVMRYPWTRIDLSFFDQSDDTTEIRR